MKFIHLSDLHLGKRVNEYSMLEDQEYILKKILNIIDAETPDGVIIAGDVYDKSVPSAEAVQLFDDFLVSLSDRKLQVFVISGNHDSAERIAFGCRIMDAGGVHLSPVYDGNVQPISLQDEFGTLNVYLLPFVKTAHVRAAFARIGSGGEVPGDREASDGGDAPGDGGVLEAGEVSGDGETSSDNESSEVSEITTYTDAIKFAIAHMNVDQNVRNVLVTHQFVTGATRSESEEISVGGTDNVDASVFEPFDYVALGHIHSPQNCGSSTIRYCGTPLKYSFSEANDKKSVTVVELAEKGNVSYKTVELVPKHDLVELKGSYAQLTSNSFYENTTWQEDYTHLTLTDEQDIPDALGKLRAVYHRVMKLDYDNTRTRTSAVISEAADVESKQPFELFADFYEQQNGQPMTADQAEYMHTLIESIWEDAR
jgi:DNA repair protein SbcD/Mre11